MMLEYSYSRKTFGVNISRNKYALSMLVMFIAINISAIGVDWAQAEALLVDDTQRSSGYTYVPGDRRDPFRSVLDQVQPITRQKAVADVSHLTKANWNILGIMSGLKGNQAVLQNAKGQRYIVSPGDVLSIENVRVVQLTNTTVTLEFFAGQKIRKKSFKPQTIELTFP